MILCPICRGVARPQAPNLSFTRYGCQDCGRNYYLPGNLAIPFMGNIQQFPVTTQAVDQEHERLRLRRRLWQLDDCIAFLLGTRQIGAAERNAYYVWRREEERRIEAQGGETGAPA